MAHAKLVAAAVAVVKVSKGDLAARGVSVALPPLQLERPQHQTEHDEYTWKRCWRRSAKLLPPPVRRLQAKAKDRASRRMSESRGSVIDSYLDVGIPSGDVFRRELDSDEFARGMMDYLLVNLQSDDLERASQIPLVASRFVMKDGLLYYLSARQSRSPGKHSPLPPV
eukprot:scaffold16143_cov129-Isochrysis_galbana.AAC.1